MAADRKRKKAKSNGKTAADAFIAWAKPFETLAEKFGLAGGILLIFIIFVFMYASTEQKRAIIDMYVLWRNPHQIWPMLTFGIINLVLFVAQRSILRKQLRVKQEEIDRLAEWKTRHQAEKIAQPTHSSTGEKGKAAHS